MEETGRIWEFILDEGIATEKELELVIMINGMSEESLSDVIYARTGYHSMEQYCECEGVEIYS